MGSGESNDPEPPPAGGVSVSIFLAVTIVLSLTASLEFYGVTASTFLGVGLVTAGGLTVGGRGLVKRTQGAFASEAAPIETALLGLRRGQRLSVNRQ